MKILTLKVPLTASFIAIFFSFFSLATQAQDGALDHSFDPGTGVDNSMATIALQSDGKILIGGLFSSYNGTRISGFARLNADGSLDTSFATSIDYPIYAVAIQSDGKILTSGTSYAYTPYTIGRLNADGSLDASFNQGIGSNGLASAIAIRSDGKIVVGGEFTSYNGTMINRIARLNTDGSLDTSFDPGSGVNGNLKQVSTVALQSDGKILIGGVLTSYNGIARSHIARLNADGSLDASFNPSTSPSHSVRAFALQSDGKILISESGIDYIARLNANGSLDASFNPGSGVNGVVSAIALQNDGKAVIGGSFTQYNGVGRNRIARILVSSITLPVTFISINAIAKNGGAEVEWRVANEIAIRYYNVERSADGRNFTTVGTVTATGGSATYSWFDAQPLNPHTYYRVKSVGQNGETKLTSIVKVSFDKNISVSIYPNPTHNKLYVTGAGSKASYQIKTVNGQLFQEGVLNDADPLDVHTLPAGLYVLMVNGNAVKFLKQ